MISNKLSTALIKPIILGILLQGNSYGYLIIKMIKEISEGKIIYSDSMLYPMLRQLEINGYIKSTWSITENTRPRKLHEITEAGKRVLLEEKEHWHQVNLVLERLWNLKPSKH